MFAIDHKAETRFMTCGVTRGFPLRWRCRSRGRRDWRLVRPARSTRASAALGAALQSFTALSMLLLTTNFSTWFMNRVPVEMQLEKDRDDRSTMTAIADEEHADVDHHEGTALFDDVLSHVSVLDRMPEFVRSLEWRCHAATSEPSDADSSRVRIPCQTAPPRGPRDAVISGALPNLRLGADVRFSPRVEADLWLLTSRGLRS